jgi:glyoxylase-like metal-dependent hydrolase (beta-lactamase superfamily II)
MMKRINGPIFLVLVLLLACSGTGKLQIRQQVTGGIQTNCYLIFDAKSGEAALIDVAGRIDSLVMQIREHDLEVKYLLCTHGHFDHIIGLPPIHKLFPQARVVMHELDYKDIFTQKEWAEKNLGPEFIEYLKADPERKKIFDFDPRSFPEPDIFPEDEQVLELGSLKIRMYHTPGHSPGSISFHVNDHLFCGDVLFHRTVGRTDTQHGSRQGLIKSVKRLYDILPDITRVHPGHGQVTDIGSEKLENSRISIYGGEWL